MPNITLSSKHQVTLPAEMVRSLGLKPGDKLIAEAFDWRIVIVKESENRLERYIGSLKGVYGKTAEDSDRYVWELRASPERDQWKRQFLDIIEQDPAAQAIAKYLLSRPRHKATAPEFSGGLSGFAQPQVDQALEKFIMYGGVRKVPAPPDVESYPWQVYMVPEIADYVTEIAQ